MTSAKKKGKANIRVAKTSPHQLFLYCAECAEGRKRGNERRRKRRRRRMYQGEI